MNSPQSSEDYFTVKSRSSSCGQKRHAAVSAGQNEAELRARVAVLENELSHQTAKAEAARQATELIISAFSQKLGNRSLDIDGKSSCSSTIRAKIKAKERECNILRGRLVNERLKVWILRKNDSLHSCDKRSTGNSVAWNGNENDALDNTNLITLADDSSTISPTVEEKPNNCMKAPRAPSPTTDQTTLAPGASTEVPLKYIHHFVPAGVTNVSPSSPPSQDRIDTTSSTCSKQRHMPISPETESSVSSRSSQQESDEFSTGKGGSDVQGCQFSNHSIHYNDGGKADFYEDRSRFSKWKANQQSHQARKLVDYSDIN